MTFNSQNFIDFLQTISSLHQLSVLHKSNEQEKASLTKHFQAEQVALHESHKQEMGALKEQCEKKMIEIEGGMHEQKNVDNMVTILKQGFMPKFSFVVLGGYLN